MHKWHLAATASCCKKGGVEGDHPASPGREAALCRPPPHATARWAATLNTSNIQFFYSAAHGSHATACETALATNASSAMLSDVSFAAHVIVNATHASITSLVVSIVQICVIILDWFCKHNILGHRLGLSISITIS